MSAASVRTSGLRDNLPVLPKATGNKGESSSLPRPVALRYWSRSSSNLWCKGSSFSFPPFSLNRRKNRFPGRLIVLDLQIHDGAVPGEGVSKSAEQGGDRGGQCAWMPRSSVPTRLVKNIL